MGINHSHQQSAELVTEAAQAGTQDSLPFSFFDDATIQDSTSTMVTISLISVCTYQDVNAFS